ncbi:sugar phosphate isomerase/epimerase family protein [Neobacillus sp. 179-C4.2 HS]|uniref:Sugar phosphate isomerase/epimerase family protein n=1 Tax=Neobacillus driksii TaxID=3035913 RepID=A0ABV4YUC7_9BACI|nr:sugar phosphate isomerase/epimerase family protein [Neobacillus sp. 179.-C4.2 HS]MDP5192785.1 sugar phosphate isomerase/epimerase [Neobacillus sp. 179.-C4.2 HS]
MMVNIGIRAHDIEADSLEELVNAISDKGLTSVQLALSKSLKNMNTDSGALSPGFARYIGDAFRDRDIQIAVLGCYINMIHPDRTERNKAMDRFKEHIRFARDFGCSIVGTETGNVNAKMGYTEENFKEQPFFDVVESVRELVAEAEKFGVIVGIEGGVNHPVHSPKVMKRLLDFVESNNLQVIFDPVNYMTIDNYKNQEDVFHEAFDLFGDRIVILHAKDFIIENNCVKTVPVGKGLLNYHALFEMLKAKKPFIQVLMEATKEPHIEDSIQFLRGLYKRSTY